MSSSTKISDEEWAERFPKPWDSEENLAVAANLEVGQQVSGEVVWRKHYGVYLDIGVGIPALLLIVRIKGITPDNYESICAVGTRMNARVFIVPKKSPSPILTQIVLTQLEEERVRRPWWKFW